MVIAICGQFVGDLFSFKLVYCIVLKWFQIKYLLVEWKQPLSKRKEPFSSQAWACFLYLQKDTWTLGFKSREEMAELLWMSWGPRRPTLGRIQRSTPGKGTWAEGHMRLTQDGPWEMGRAEDWTRDPAGIKSIHFKVWVREDPLEKEMATHSSILTWWILWTEEPGRLHGVHGVARVGHDWSDLARTHKRESWFEEMYKVSDCINALGVAKIMTGVCECLWFGKHCSWWLLVPMEEKWSPLIRN